MNDLDLISTWTDHPIDFTYCSPTDTSFSIIDHFFLKDDFKECINDAGVIHLGDNASGHSPIYLKINVGPLHSNHVQQRKFCPRQNWVKATYEDKINFKNSVSEYLANLHIPASLMDCLNPSCTDPAHLFHIDQYSINVIKILEDSAAEYIPYTRSVSEKSSKKRKSIPGWVELVKPHQDKAQFWYQIWHSAGKPVVGELFNIMRFTRNQYKYARRKCLRAVETTKRDKFVEACVRGDKHMLEELKKIRQSKCATVSKVDGISDPDKIADHFGHVYRDIYNREANNEPSRELFIKVNQSCA